MEGKETMKRDGGKSTSKRSRLTSPSDRSSRTSPSHRPISDVILNAEFSMLMLGLCSILTTYPGYVTNESSHHNQFYMNHMINTDIEIILRARRVPSTRDIPYEFVAEERVRYCRHCKAYVKGFNHHCPAFGNCIGQKNHVLFTILLFGFVFTEASYVECSSQCKLEYIGY
ncbi:Palmitoyltransferase AKR1 [Camellia lanceoleosa]|nr:Palmitoyltransferase AKR1 [Camellia lanceoleosa]